MPGMLNGKDNRSGLEEGFPDEFTAHTGMLEAAKRIYKLLVADEQPSLRHEYYFELKSLMYHFLSWPGEKWQRYLEIECYTTLFKSIQFVSFPSLFKV